MSKFQAYLSDITKKAQEITTRNLAQSQKRTPSGKKQPLKLSQKDISTLRTLREKARTGLPTQGTGTGFAKLAAYGNTYKNPTQDENYLKAKALDLLTKGTIKSYNQSQFIRTRRRGRRPGGVWGFMTEQAYFDPLEASGFENYILSANALIANETINPQNNPFHTRNESVYLLDKDRMIKVLSNPKNYKQGINKFQADYLLQIFSDKNLEDKIYNYTYTGPTTRSGLVQGKKYFKLGTFHKVVNDILSNKTNPYYVKGYSAIASGQGSFAGLRQINDLELWKQEYISNFEKTNQSFKNVLSLAAQENSLVNKYLGKSQMFSGMGLSNYNKLVTEAQANTKKMYDSLKVYLQTASNQVDRRGKITGANAASNMYKYGLDDAKKYATLSETAYRSALTELQKTLGISEKQYDITVKTQEDTVKQITNILDSQKAINKPKGNVIASRRAALDVAISKDRPSYSGLAKKATFIQRPN